MIVLFYCKCEYPVFDGLSLSAWCSVWQLRDVVLFMQRKNETYMDVLVALRSGKTDIVNYTHVYLFCTVVYTLCLKKFPPLNSL